GRTRARTRVGGPSHDTKRSGGVRASMGSRAGSAGEWAAHVCRWSAMHAAEAPDWTERLLIYQTLVGAWPLEPERLESYVEKALREAKRNTNWIDPNLGWEGQVEAFCRARYHDKAFLAHFRPVAARCPPLRERSALSQ